MPFRSVPIRLSPRDRALLTSEDKRHATGKKFRRLSESDVVVIRALAEVGYSQDDIALTVRCSQRAVSRAVLGQTQTAQRA